MPVFVDKDSIRENFMDDNELIFESIDLFMDSSASRFKALQEAVAAKDADRVMAEAHALKGVVGIFSPGDVMDAAKDLEFMGRNHNLEGVDAALAKFGALLSELTRILQEWKEEEPLEEDDEDE
ncbi:MAG: Hpt domain-containing protein [Deltaproteobacteria bacterium]|jgi:HPt (histidine-containing phosphotransfer) domain-containing protein|nr:Hpt domain-containing protein [Deltaproteobacteria bacterium]